LGASGEQHQQQQQQQQQQQGQHGPAAAAAAGGPDLSPCVDPLTGKPPYLRSVEQLAADFWQGTPQGRGLMEEVRWGRGGGEGGRVAYEKEW
jgi:hypothetical protein